MSLVSAHTTTHHRQLVGRVSGNAGNMLSAVLPANDVHTFGADVMQERMALTRHWVASVGGGVAVSGCTNPRVRC
jgi:hypothetical protein